MDGQILSRGFSDVHGLDVDVGFDALVERGTKLLVADPQHSERAMRHQLAEEFGLSLEAAVCAAAAAGSEFYYRHVEPRLKRRGKR
jgi:hypothetical protein